MQHVEPDLLALLALGERVDSSIDGVSVSEHLSACPFCRDEVRSLRATAEVARTAAGHRGDEGVHPPDRVWHGIVAELGLADTAAAPTAGSADEVSGLPPTGAGRPGNRGSRRRPRRPPGPGARRRWTRTAAALVATAAVGVGGTLVAVRPWTASARQTVAFAAPLTPVRGGPSGVRGQARVVLSADGPRLAISASGLPLREGFYEVWMYDPDAGAGHGDMVAVGTLGAGTDSDFILPPTLNLRSHHIVDISAEQYDGNQAHSTISVLRGVLTS